MKPLRDYEEWQQWLADNPQHDEFVDQQEQIRQYLVDVLVAGACPARAIVDAGMWPYHLEAALAEANQKIDDAEDLAKKHRQTIQDMDATIGQLRRERDSRNPEDLNPDMYARVMDRARASLVAQSPKKRKAKPTQRQAARWVRAGILPVRTKR